MSMRRFILFSLLVATTTAAPVKFSSGENRTHLIELYSSEGCSSCPPAEAWLGGLREAPGLWRDFVPVAFPINYWDRLGWPDRFAKKEFTARQYAYASQWHSESVYTPEFVLDGAEWRKNTSAPPSRSAENAGVLSVAYDEAGVCTVKFDPKGDYEVYAAVLGAEIFSEVQAGENRGRKLRHDFVVLELKTAKLSGGIAELNLPKSAEKGIGRQALAVWVTRQGALTPVQATGGWLE